jgi:NADH-quinone oxidoreductase subunit G
MRTDVRRGKTLRRLAGEDPTVNDEWNCDKGRWAFKYQTAQDRITTPLVRNAAGELVPASWPEALEAAAAGLTAGRAAVLVGGRATVEDAYGYSKFARVTLGTNDIDFRSRVSSDEERAFLASNVIGNQTSYRDIDNADQVVLVSFEPEEESPIVFLRLNKAFRKRALKVHAVASKLSIGNEKLKANFICVAPGNEVSGLSGLTLTEKSVILVGERAAETPGLLTAVSGIAARSKAKLAWIPRRAGERGAIEAGAIGNLLPGGRPVSDAAARVDISAAWGVHGLPEARGLSTDEIYAAAANGEIKALLVGGVDPLDGSNTSIALDALQKSFVVSLEMRPSAVTDRANVVLPVAAVAEKSGTFLNWEGRGRSFDIAIPDSIQRSDLRILSVLADQIGRKIGISTVAQAAAELNSIGTWDGNKSEFGGVNAAPAPTLSGEQALLTSWRRLLDNGSLQDGEANLAGTARKTVAVISPKRASAIGVTDGDLVKISNDKGALVLPVLIEAIHDDAVWAPRNSAGSELLRTLGVASNSVVTVVKA